MRRARKNTTRYRYKYSHFHPLALFMFVMALVVPKIVHAQDGVAQTVTVQHDGQSYELPIPEGFCDETHSIFGTIMAEGLRPMAEQASGLINVKAILKKCSYGKLYPWSYVSIGPDIGISLTQEQFNEIQAKMVGNEALFDNVFDILLEDLGDHLGVQIEGLSFSSPKIILSNEHANIFMLRINDNTPNPKLAVASSSLIKNRTIDYYTYIDAKDEILSLRDVVQSLNENAMKLKALNKSE